MGPSQYLMELLLVLIWCTIQSTCMWNPFCKSWHYQFLYNNWLYIYQNSSHVFPLSTVILGRISFQAIFLLNFLALKCLWYMRKILPDIYSSGNYLILEGRVEEIMKIMNWSWFIIIYFGRLFEGNQLTGRIPSTLGLVQSLVVVWVSISHTLN